MTAPASASRRGALGTACAGLAASAAVLWGASAAPWYRVAVESPGRGAQLVALDGGQVLPALVATALFALAAVAAVVATGGLLRRAVGVLVILLGGFLAVSALVTAVGSALPDPPADVSGAAWSAASVETTGASWLAVAGGLLLVGSGLFVVLREPRMARLGARYAAPSRRPAEVDPDRAAWLDLDAGRDPTADPSTGAGGAPLRADGTLDDLPADPAAGVRRRRGDDPGGTARPV